MNLFIRIRNEKMNKLVFILINIKINKLKKKKIIRKHFFFFFGFRGRPDFENIYLKKNYFPLKGFD